MPEVVYSKTISKQLNLCVVIDLLIRFANQTNLTYDYQIREFANRLRYMYRIRHTSYIKNIVIVIKPWSHCRRSALTILSEIESALAINDWRAVNGHTVGDRVDVDDRRWARRASQASRRSQPFLKMSQRVGGHTVGDRRSVCTIVSVTRLLFFYTHITKPNLIRIGI